MITPAALHGGRVRRPTTTIGWPWPARCSGLRVPGVRVDDMDDHAQDPAGLHRPVAAHAGRRDDTVADGSCGRGRRPGPAGPQGKSRPRSKDRPAHAAGAPGRSRSTAAGTVRSAVHRDAVDDAGRRRRSSRVKARELGRKGVVVGDRVWLVGDVARRAGPPGPDRPGRGARDRRCAAAPTTPIPIERVIVANADQLAWSPHWPTRSRSPGLIDRCLVAAYDAGLDPLLVLTKSDLADPATSSLDAYAPLEVPAVVCGMTEDGSADAAGLDELTSRARGPGHRASSGTPGWASPRWSTRWSRAPSGDRGRERRHRPRPAHVDARPWRSRWPGGGWIIDTPGVRSFGLAHVDARPGPARVLGVRPRAGGLPARVPAHEGAVDCALDAFAASGAAGESGPARLESLRRLLATRPPEPGALRNRPEADAPSAAGDPSGR